ncbi:hypothetical protein PEp14_00011 [Erwinia phage PEp14]|uniref:Uncharacterized protein n=1 Tax=Erwinia phage PEp14 TaxID=1131315 RepID=H2DE41_9CAUD|nr:virion structural protein [Erwinia phage PEp14]AEY69600.1 hypothetical protein PEp14_00011 [Erwinia phage PEp14]
MALISTQFASGVRPTYRPQTAGALHSQLFHVAIPAGGFASGDILELAILPPYARIVDAQLILAGGAGVAGQTADVGIMSGEPGEPTNDDGSARTMGNELFAGAALDGIQRLGKTDALFVKKTDKARSIGVKFNAAVPFVAGKQVALQLHFAQ